MARIPIYLLLTCVAALSSCRKAAPELTRYKQFSYRIDIDGTGFHAEELSFWGGSEAMKTAVTKDASGNMDFLFNASYITTSEVSIYIKNFTGKGLYTIRDTAFHPYPLSPPYQTQCSYYHVTYPSGTSGSGALHYWITSPSYAGLVNIAQFDSSTVEADFEFTGINPYTGSTKHIKGYFIERK